MQDDTPETYVNVVDQNGPGFEHDPQDSVVKISVEINTSYCGNCLNVKAWESHLQDYLDFTILQYIKFGYPLSITNSEELCNKETTNHYSVCQYAREIQMYIYKENSFGALVGPVHDIVHPQYHSPLKTRPKDNGSKRVVDDVHLSYPQGHSVNSHLDKNKFGWLCICVENLQYRSHYRGHSSLHR